MSDPGVYVVRLYRRSSAGMAGVVESVATGEQMPFHSIEQLWQALRKLPTSWRIQPKTDEEDTP